MRERREKREEESVHAARPRPRPLSLSPLIPSLSLSSLPTAQTGKVVAVKKIRLGNAKEVREGKRGEREMETAGLWRPHPHHQPSPHPLSCSLLLSPALSPSQGVSVTALREVKILRELAHPHVVTLEDVVLHKRGAICLVRRDDGEREKT